MKNLCLILFLIITIPTIVAQPPQAFKYQAVVRDNTGEILQNQSVGVRISIHDITAGGTILYQETFSETSNQFGLVNLDIGKGTPTIGIFSGIDWSSNSKFIETEIDPSGGTTYVSIGTSELLSVPYALYSRATGDTSKWIKKGDTLYYNTGNVGIGTSSPQGEFHVSNPAEWLGITFTGSGINDLTVDHSNYNGSNSTQYIAEVTNAGPNPNIFKWSNDNGATWTEDVQMVTSGITVGFGVTIGFGAVYGHTFGDQWLWSVSESFMNGLIVKNGKVGIGTSNPATGLHFKEAGGEVMRIESENLENYITIHNSNGYIGYFGTFNGDYDMDIGTGGSNTYGKLHLTIKASPKMTINEYGKVGIGKTDPNYKLDVNGTVNSSNASDDGFRSTYSTDNGFHARYSGNDGVNVFNSTEHGVNVYQAGKHGVNVYNSYDDGVYSDAYGYHLYWGFYTEDQTYSQGGYYPAKSGTFAKNIGQNTLEPGDLVCISGGYEENVLGEECVPVVNISKANGKNSKAIFGVVESQVYIREKTEEIEDGETLVQKSFRFSDEIIKSGDYLSVIVFGIADVKVDPDENYNSGEMLTAGEGFARKVQTREIEGIIIAENTGILGKALEDSHGKEKIKVFVNCK